MAAGRPPLAAAPVTEVAAEPAAIDASRAAEARAEPAMPAEPAAQGTSPDEPAPWPSAADEAAFLGQKDAAPAAQGEAAAAQTPEKEKLPSLEEVLPRVPAAVRAMLQDLFRAEFSVVRRIPAPKSSAVK